jgi:hypothetical protein
MTDDNDPRASWDCTSTVLVVLAIVVLAVLTFEIWAPHLGMHR